MTPSEAFREALLKLTDEYVDTSSDAADAIEALRERADFLSDWRNKQDQN